MEIKFKFAAIKIDQFATFDYPGLSLADNFSVSGEVQTGSNYGAKSILITVSSNYNVGDKLVATIRVTSVFAIENESWEHMKNDGFVVVPKEFLYHIGGLAVSTTRGVLFAKTEGADLNRFILPIIQMDQVIKGDMKIAIQES